MTTTFISLPPILKRKVASFLEYRSAIALSRTSKCFHSDLCLIPLRPVYQLIPGVTFVGDGQITADVPFKTVRIPVFATNTHSVCLQCDWAVNHDREQEDQPLRNVDRNGRIYVVEHDESMMESVGVNSDDSFQQLERELFGGGKVIFKSPLCNRVQCINMSFVPRVDKEVNYYLWISVGGGGRNSVAVGRLQLHTLVFDDLDKTTTRAFNTLQNLSVFGTFDSQDDHVLVAQYEESFTEFCLLFKSIVDTISNALQDSYNEIFSLKSLFVDRDLHVDSASMKAVRRICDFLLDSTSGQVSDECCDSRAQPNKRSTEVTLQHITIAKDWNSDIVRRTRDTPVPFARIPFFRGLTTSLRLTGNCLLQPASRLSIIAMPFQQAGCVSDVSSTFDSNLAKKRTVWDIVADVTSVCEIDVIFNPREDETYVLNFETSRNGIEYIRSLKLQATISFGDDSEQFQRCFQELVIKGILDSRVNNQVPFQTSFHISSLKGALHFLKENHGTKTPLHGFFASRDIPTDPFYLDCLRNLLLRNEAFIVEKGSAHPANVVRVGS
ncbi:hypothetical protein IV203_035012 [Nitzschia inconspicua]|uniref:F-box domain-containing protein n=1 Tax=Nitzschia inconspicua TaxID=303405 RepID=A0A9K3LCQ6_9STRA|nr:hypothetical protein IV203_035012 [Nitzschia inconspicua]